MPTVMPTVSTSPYPNPTYGPVPVNIPTPLPQPIWTPSANGTGNYYDTENNPIPITNSPVPIDIWIPRQTVNPTYGKPTPVGTPRTGSKTNSKKYYPYATATPNVFKSVNPTYVPTLEAIATAIPKLVPTFQAIATAHPTQVWKLDKYLDGKLNISDIDQ